MEKLELHQVNPCLQRGGETQRTTITQEFTTDDMTIVIDNVTAAVRTQCGEEYVPGNVARIIGRFVREIIAEEQRREEQLSLNSRSLHYDAEQRFRSESEVHWVPA